MKYHLETAWQYCIGNVVPLIILTLVLAAVSTLSVGILAPVAFAGYTDSLNQLLKNKREPKPLDIFSQLKLFLPLFIFGLVIFIIILIGITLFILPGVVFSVVIGYTCLYLIPIMVETPHNAPGLIDALKKSISLVTQAPVTDHIVVFIIFFALTAVGGSSLIGFLFLQPFATLFLLSVYKQIR